MRPNRLEGLLAVAMAAIAGGAVAPFADAREAPAARTVQLVAELHASHRVLVAPHGRAAPVSLVRAFRPITGGRTALPVIGRTTTPDGVGWLRVMVPDRPNGTTGWIAQSGTVLTGTRWRVTVSTSRRQVQVFHRGRLVGSFAAIVGAPSTPTPNGRFFVEESVRMPLGSAGAPFALALSARSNVLRDFEGGPGQIAIHGVANLDGALGTAASHGCVRLAGRTIRWMSQHVAPGTPVTINP